MQPARHEPQRREQPAERVQDRERQDCRRKNAEYLRRSAPFRSQHNLNDIVRKQPTNRRQRQRKHDDERVGLEKISAKPFGIVASARQRGKRDLANGGIKLSVGKLIRVNART